MRARIARKAGATDMSRHPEWVGQITATQRELLNFDGEADAEVDGMEPGASIFDFRAADRDLVKRYSFGYAKFCKPPAEYDGLPHSLTDEAVECYSKFARDFFVSPVVLKTDNSNLYDDEEAAVIASMFRRSDRPILYAMDKFRRTVGENAYRLTRHFTNIVGLLILSGWLLHWTDARLALGPALAWGLFGSVFVVCVAYAIWMRTVYAKARDSGMAEFSGLLERYLAGVSDKFHQATSKMIGAILGEEEDHDALAANAQKWHRIMMWQGFRTFFIESFLRSVNFQMRRNLGFYAVLAFVFLVAAPLVSIAFAMQVPLPAGSVDASLWLQHPIVWSATSFCFGLILFLLAQKKEIDAALSQKDWRGFESLQMDEKMRDILGKYAQEAAIGKRRGMVRHGGGSR
ncbi:MAG: hypothetical protein ABL957_06830 [Parvularculaceae bacterium]